MINLVNSSFLYEIVSNVATGRGLLAYERKDWKHRPLENTKVWLRNGRNVSNLAVEMLTVWYVGLRGELIQGIPTHAVV